MLGNKANNKQGMNGNIAEINQNIKDANNSLQKNEEELMGKINKTLEKLDEGEIEKKKNAPKKNLSSLMANVNKLKTKSKKQDEDK